MRPLVYIIFAFTDASIRYNNSIKTQHATRCLLNSGVSYHGHSARKTKENKAEQTGKSALQGTASSSSSSSYLSRLQNLNTLVFTFTCDYMVTCDHVFEPELSIYKDFSTLIIKTINHRQVFLVSHHTYLVQLLYLGKLSRPKYHEFSLKLLIFPKLQY